MLSENVKFLYKSQEIFMKLFNEYSSIASKDKKNNSWKKNFKYVSKRNY